ncbi:MAG TPA: hypothetical protein VFU46_14815 [Gemmatimonadales bacterium]|nr:hypothetical protein [Gemmatimonadales bacterium]
MALRRTDGGAGRAVKIVAGAVSTAAAVASIVSTASSLNERQGAAAAGPLGPKRPEVRWIGVAPQADTVFAIGDTVRLAATIADAHGTMVPGVSPVWSSDRLDVASVDSAGAVVATGQGVATIEVRAGGRAARATITVRQAPTGVAIVGDSVLSVPEGERVRATAWVLDARGHEIVGLAPAWHSAELSIAGVDATGEVTAIAPGRTVLTAELGGSSARLAVEVVPVPASLTVVNGEGQRAPAGRRLGGAVAVQVVSRGGRPIGGVPVRFVVAEDAGSVEPAIDTSDAQGMARATWTLGATPGRQRLVPTVDGIAALPLVVAEADPLPANTRVALASEGASGLAGELMSEPVIIRVTDSAGAALPDLPVAWIAGDGGLVVEHEARTDSLGQARARWRLGRRAGLQAARAQVGNPRTLPPFVVTAVAHTGAPRGLAVVGGNRQRGPVGAALRQPVMLRVTDALGNPVPGAAVVARPAVGSVADSLVATDSSGRAAVRWTLGSGAGAQRLVVRLEGADTAVEIAAVARPLAPANLAFEPVPASGAAGRPLPQRVAVVVTDAYGNPVGDRAVAFSVRAGRVAPARVMSDGRGRAATQWTLGSKPGEQAIAAAVAGAGLKVTATTDAKAAATQAKAATKRKP